MRSHAGSLDLGVSGGWEAPHYVRSLTLGTLAVLLGFQISGWVFAISAAQQGRVDFRSFYTAGYLVRTGRSHQLYDYSTQVLFQNQTVSARTMALPFIHPPYEVVLFVPFSYFPFRSAYFAFLLFNVALVMISARLMRPWTSTLDQIYPWLSAAMMFLFLPTVVAFMQGQDSIVLLLCLTGAFAALERGHEKLAGILLSLGLFKFQIVLPIAFLFLCWRRWRFSAAFALSGLALAVGSLAMVGIEGAKSYLRLLLSISVHLGSQSEQATFGVPPLMMPNLRGLTFGLFSSVMSPVGIQMTVLILSAICVLATFFWGSRTQEPEGKFLIAVVAGTVISYHSLIHDMSILLLPILVILNQCIRGVSESRSLERQAVEVATVAFISPMLFLFSPGRFYLVSLALCAFLYTALRWTRTADLNKSPVVNT